jgi:hypothetical protein
VSFELGPQGTYTNAPVTSFVVEDGTSLSGLNGTAPGLFNASDFSSSNIKVISDFEFAGWSPTLDPDAKVYTDLVYRAQYAYEPQGLSHTEYTPLEVDENPPSDYTIQALGYEGYYDGAPHGVRYTASSSTGLSNILSFWYDPSAKGLPLSKSIQPFALPPGGIWAQGLPPDEIDVTDEEVDLIFTADGKTPQEVTRRIVIKPRPLVPAATHVDMTVGDGIPLRPTYDLTIAYDGNKSDGTLIGDDFDFAGHESEFEKDGLQISTTYLQGDPAGTYPLYVKAGVYGNYEIYEGTEDDWPFFSGWRFAGVMQVKAQSDTPGDGGDDGGDSSTNGDGTNGGGSGGGKKVPQSALPATGDTVNLALLAVLIGVSLTSLAALLFALYQWRRPPKRTR